jgi:plasmid stabilization system protein ParE
MGYPYILNKLAHEEYIAAYEWYELKQEGLGDKFMLAVEKRLLQISQHPEHYGKAHLNFRQTKVENFPYMVVYEIFTRKQQVHIAAIYHQKRNQKKKYRRLRK